jgi:dTMP kinase
LNERGLLITFEGIDGAGKSTQMRQLAAWLREQGHTVCVTREPGGTRVGERIRSILLASSSPPIAALTELLLMYAARRQHLEEVILPALKRGELVLSDRFNDASFAYQGYGRKLGEGPVYLMDQLICGRTQPDLTLVLDAPPRLTLARARKRARGNHSGRFEEEGATFQERVRRGYLAISRREPGRVKVVPAGGTAARVQQHIRDLVGAFLRRQSKRRASRL